MSKHTACVSGVATLSLTFTLFVGHGAAGAAEPHEAARADVLFKEAREAMKRGDYKTACPKLVESHQLDPAPGTLFNLAECREKEGQLAVAYRYLSEALETLAAGDSRRPGVQASMAALEKRLGKLVVQIDESTLLGIRAIAVDDVVIDVARLRRGVFVMPGTRRVVASAKNGDVGFDGSVTLAAGESRSVVVVLTRPESAGTARPPEKPSNSSQLSTKKVRTPSGTAVLGWAMAVTGGISSLIGTVLVAKDSASRGTGVLLLGGGVPVLGIGIVLIASSDGSPSVSLAPPSLPAGQFPPSGHWLAQRLRGAFRGRCSATATTERLFAG